jgi:hypothetical protein
MAAVPTHPIIEHAVKYLVPGGRYRGGNANDRGSPLFSSIVHGESDRPERGSLAACSLVKNIGSRAMEPFTFAVLFAALAGGLAVARVVGEYRQSNKELRRIALRGQRRGY